MALAGDRELPFGRRRATDRADLAVGPRLFGDPGEFVDAVSQRWSKDVVVSLREEASAFVHLHVGVAAFDGFEFAREIPRHAVADVPEVEVVGRSEEHT